MSSSGGIEPAVDPRRRWLGFAALAGGLAMVVLDGTIVGVALPRIIDDLRLALTDGEWITTFYSVIFAALLLTFGRLGDRIGRRLVFQIGVVLFTGASLWLAGGADAPTLILGRAVQGVAGAMVLPSSLSSVNATFRGRDRAVAFGLWGAIMAGVAAVGPLLGGWLTQAFGWPWIFLVNVPLGVVVLALAVNFAPESRRDDESVGFDLPGLLTSSLGFGLLTFGLIEGWNLGWWSPTTDFEFSGLTWPQSAPVSVVPVALGLGAGSLVGFLQVERRRARHGLSVLLDLTLFEIPTFAWGNLTAAMVSVGEFALLFVLPLYLVFALGLSVLSAGGVLATMAVGAFVAGAGARHLASRLGPPRVVVIGLVLELIAGVGTALILTFAPSVLGIAALMAVYGLGLGLAAAQLTSTVLHDVPSSHSGSASATQSTVRQLGAALGAAAAGTALAAGFTVTVPAFLHRVAGVSADDAITMIDYMVRSAGGVIGWIRDKGTEGHFGALGPQVADQLAAAFAVSASWAVWAACAFIALGVAGAFAVRRAARVSGGTTLGADEPVLSEGP